MLVFKTNSNESCNFDWTFHKLIKIFVTHQRTQVDQDPKIQCLGSQCNCCNSSIDIL